MSEVDLSAIQEGVLIQDFFHSLHGVGLYGLFLLQIVEFLLFVGKLGIEPADRLVSGTGHDGFYLGIYSLIHQGIYGSILAVSVLLVDMIQSVGIQEVNETVEILRLLFYTVKTPSLHQGMVSGL